MQWLYNILVTNNSIFIISICPRIPVDIVCCSLLISWRVEWNFGWFLRGCVCWYGIDSPECVKVWRCWGSVTVIYIARIWVVIVCSCMLLSIGSMSLEQSRGWCVDDPGPVIFHLPPPPVDVNKPAAAAAADYDCQDAYQDYPPAAMEYISVSLLGREIILVRGCENVADKLR